MTEKQRVARSAESSTTALDVRLGRAHDEIDKLKADLAVARTAAQDLAKQHKAEVAGLQAALKRADKQKLELLAAFKKQLKLIDVLRRQRAHVSVGEQGQCS